MQFYHPLEALHDKIQRKLERGTGLHLSPSDMDWFVVSGAYAALMNTVVERAFQRSAKRLADSGYDLGFVGHGPTPNPEERGTHEQA
jgi:hypothetical protein